MSAWADQTPWVRWLELGGSLGRGAGDDWSDVDAGAGVLDPSGVRDEVHVAMRELAPVADSIVQMLGDRPHVIVQYDDGRQLSLVLVPADARPGLPPGSVALVDKTGHLSHRWARETVAAPWDLRREWAFLAWWAVRDTRKHAWRGNVWRAMRALGEGRDLAWQLHAAALGVDYPVFGAVSVENAGLGAPEGMAGTLPADDRQESVVVAAEALAAVLEPLTRPYDVDGVRRSARDFLLGHGPR